MTSLPRSIDRSYAEQLLHASTEAGSYCNGDVDAWDASRWPEWTQDWFYNPEPDVAEADLVAATLAESDEIWDLETANEHPTLNADDPEYRAERMEGFIEEFEAWVALLDESYEQQERHRDCGFGHPA